MAEIFFGEPEGVNVGDIYPSRKALIKANLHRSTMHGIDGNGNEGVSAIVMSGGYEDDIDYGDEIIYTGHGGNDPATGKQISDQSWNDSGNKGLRRNITDKKPVRVIRGSNHNSVFAPSRGYRYDGLYEVVEAWQKVGKSGKKICQFRLVKFDLENDEGISKIVDGCLVLLKPTKSELKWFAIGVDPPLSINAQKLSVTSKLSQLLLEKQIGDKIDLGNGFEIQEIKKYKS